MKIGIDARMLGSGFGLARYVQQLVIHLEKNDSSNQYVLFMRRENWREFTPKNPNFTKVLADVPWYSNAEQIILPWIIKKQKLDLMHFTHWNVPLLYRQSFVVTVHDLIMYHYPRAAATTHGPLIYKIKDALHRLTVKNAVKRSKKIITTSEFTKQDIAETLNIPENKMHTIYQAPFPKIPSIKPPEEILKEYNVAAPFVLYVGSAYPHKNLEGLLKAWQIFKKTYHTNHQLILIGQENFFYKKLQTVDWPKLPDSIRNSVKFLGFIPDNKLVAFYHQAALYVFPSFYEGFGLPPLEAISYGVPVVSSNQTCLPEILQSAALYFDPRNHEQMAKAIQVATANPQLREQLILAGQKVCSSYSWDQLANKTIQIYQNVDK